MVETVKEKSEVNTDRLTEMEAIVSEHETSLIRYASRILNNPSAAQDVVQNVFIKLFRNWKEGTRPSPQLKGWLYRVTHNEAVDHIRRESRLGKLHVRHSEEAEIQCPDGHNCPAANVDRKTMVLKLLNKLKPQEQQVILLRLDQGLSYSEISTITGRSEGNVGNILHHAVKRLSGMIANNLRDL